MSILRRHSMMVASEGYQGLQIQWQQDYDSWLISDSSRYFDGGLKIDAIDNDRDIIYDPNNYGGGFEFVEFYLKNDSYKGINFYFGESVGEASFGYGIRARFGSVNMDIYENGSIEWNSQIAEAYFKVFYNSGYLQYYVDDVLVHTNTNPLNDIFLTAKAILKRPYLEQ